MTPKSKSVRIAILLCDTPIPAIAESQGDYYAIFDKLLRESYPASHARDDPRLFVLDGYDVVKERRYPKHEDGEYDAVIITGSGAFVPPAYFALIKDPHHPWALKLHLHTTIRNGSSNSSHTLLHWLELNPTSSS
jgi:hypothetical protein